MKLKQLFERQKEVQDISNMHPKDTDKIYAAIFAELGEYLNELKADWAWWKRKDKVFVSDNDAALEELADILHFWLLLGLAKADYDLDSLSVAGVTDAILNAELSDDVLERRKPISVGEAARWFGVEPESFYNFLDLVAAGNFLITDVIVSYMAKTQKNLDRWN